MTEPSQEALLSCIYILLRIQSHCRLSWGKIRQSAQVVLKNEKNMVGASTIGGELVRHSSERRFVDTRIPQQVCRQREYVKVSSFISDMLIVAVFMLAGFFIREMFKPVQKLFLPSSLIGWLLLLILGPQILNLVDVPASCAKLPNVLIDIVMTSLVFGVNFDRDKLMSYLDYVCVPMPIYGIQMALGVWLGYILQKTWPGLPTGWGVMGVFSFHGGHGTAAAATTFERLGIQGNMSVGMVL